MLRRVARVLRFLLFAMGISLLVWLPATFIWWGNVMSPYPSDSLTVFGISDGVVGVMVWESIPSPGFDPTFFTRPPEADVSLTHCLLPWITREPAWPVTVVTFPLWLLAFACLAWPVTSFLLARRRRGRGFAVEPLPTPLPPGEVPSLRGGEGGHQDTPD